MPVLVVKFPEDQGRKVNMSRFLSKYLKRDFSVIVDVDKEELSHIFNVLNRNHCEVLIAQDTSMKIDFEVYFLLYQLNKLTGDVESELKGEFSQLKNFKQLRKIFKNYKDNSDIFLSTFEKEYIVSKENRLLFDWQYRIRVLFDSITILALDLNSKLDELDKKGELDNNFRFLHAVNSGCKTLIEIMNFTDINDEEELKKIEDLVTYQLIFKKPYRISDAGSILLKFIIDHVRKQILYKLPIDEDTLLEVINDDQFARTYCNLLMNLGMLTIKNRIETGYFKDFKEFQNVHIDPDSYKSLKI